MKRDQAAKLREIRIGSMMLGLIAFSGGARHDEWMKVVMWSTEEFAKVKITRSIFKSLRRELVERGLVCGGGSYGAVYRLTDKAEDWRPPPEFWERYAHRFCAVCGSKIDDRPRNSTICGSSCCEEERRLIHKESRRVYAQREYKKGRLALAVLKELGVTL